MKFRLGTLLTSIAFSSLFAPQLHAALVVTSENFDSPPAAGSSDLPGEEPGGGESFGFPFTIANWGESNVGPANAAFDEFHDYLAPAGNGVVGEDGNAAGFEDTGFIYREIGTQDSFLAIEVGGRNLRRGNQANNALVQLFSLASADPFTFQESGNDIATDPGAFLVGQGLTLFPGLDGNGDVEAPVSFSFSFDTSMLPNGERLFVRLSTDTGTNGTEPAYVDDLTFSAVAVPVPEPSSLAVLGLITAGMLRRRKSS